MKPTRKTSTLLTVYAATSRNAWDILRTHAYTWESTGYASFWRLQADVQ